MSISVALSRFVYQFVVNTLIDSQSATPSVTIVGRTNIMETVIDIVKETRQRLLQVV